MLHVHVQYISISIKRTLHPWSATAEMERDVKKERMEESEET